MASILHVINRMEIGGVEVGVLSLLKSGLSNYKILTVRGCDPEFLATLTPAERDKVIVCNGIFSSVISAFKYNPDVVVTSLWRSHIVGLFLKLVKPGCKRIHFVHASGFAHYFDCFFSRISLFFSNRVFCDSETTANLTKKYIDSNCNISIVPMNVSFGCNVIKKNKLDLKFIFIGRFNQIKNITDSIKFINNLRNWGLTVSFDIFGRDDGDKIHLENLIKKLSLQEVVRIRGPIRPELVENTMSEYSFYLQNSVKEGMSISVFQSLRSGLIPVVTPVGEIPNYTEDSVNAFYISNDLELSSKRFHEMFVNGNFNDFSVGSILNEKNYPSFHEAFKLALNESYK
ncbi:glycosyltransferase family 4 protein [Vibrio breoganii]